MHTFRSSFRSFNEPLLTDATTSDTPETAPTAVGVTSNTEARASTSMSFRTKKTSPTTTTTTTTTTSTSNTSFASKSSNSNLSLSPSSFLRRKKEKIPIIKLDPVATPNGLSNDTTTTTMVGNSNKGKGKVGGVNPHKGIMALNNDDDVAILPKRGDSLLSRSSSSPPSTPTSSIRDSLFRIRSPSYKKKVTNTTTTTTNIHTSKSAVDSAVATSISMIDDSAFEEDDPVLALYTTRNTQKVRFSLGEVEPKERTYSSTDGNGSSSTTTSPNKDGSGRGSKRSAGGVDSKFNIKKFMRGALFGGSSNGSNKKSSNEEFELEFEREMEEATKNCDNEMIWSTQEDGIPEVLRTTAKRSSSGVTPYTTSDTNANSNASVDGSAVTGVKVSFAEDYETRAMIIKLINKARRAQFLHYRYEYAVKCYMKALEILRSANYPEDHPTVIKTMKLLQSAHQANSSYNDSANIVKLGIKYEDSGELIRALKMYTIAYRIRSEALGPNHPSLVVLLNMLGSVQIKCGELDEAMAIYELALKDTEPPKNSCGGSSGDDNNSMSSNTITPDGISVPTNYVTRAVTYREMGTIYEQWGEPDRALKMYHKSLDCMAEYKGLKQSNMMLLNCDTHFEEKKEDDMIAESPSLHDEILHDLESTHLSTSAVAPRSPNAVTQQQKSSKDKNRAGGSDNNEDRSDEGGLELTFGESSRKSGRRISSNIKTSSTSEVMTSRYDIFFPPSLDEKKRKKRLSVGGSSNHNKKHDEKMGDYTDVDVALTIHRIAQLHRAQQEYDLALPAFYVSLRGMKYALGKSHPNVAAILGNIGNLQKEMGDMDSAYTTYQQVLAIESYRLGLSHPDVVVTLHNISTIDAARGNHEHALSLYTQVVTLQRKLFGEDHESVAVTSACMGDVYERLGKIKSAVECYEEALRIKIMALGRHSLEVARLLHKLGKLAVTEEDFHLAHSYISKALLVYRLNKLRDDDEWVIDVNRDAADVDAAIAMGRGGDIVEC